MAPGRDGSPELQTGRGDIVFSGPFCLFKYFHFSSYGVPLFLSLILFLFICSHAKVFRETLLYEFCLSYSHTEWRMLSSLSESCDKTWKLSAVKLNSKLTIFFSMRDSKSFGFIHP